jgi:hypothetical protein
MIPDELLENVLGKQICMHLTSKKDKSDHERAYCYFRKKFVTVKLPCNCSDYEIEVIRKC